MAARLEFTTSDPANTAVVDPGTGSVLFEIKTALDRGAQPGAGRFTTSVVDAREGNVAAVWDRKWAREPDRVTVRGETKLMTEWLRFNSKLGR